MKILVTGAAGRLGLASRPVLAAAGHTLRSTDLPDRGYEPLPGETVLAGNLVDPAFADAALAGVDVVVHWAATSNEQAFPLVLENNHHMLFELYEAARRQGVRRVVYASSNHAFGLHETGRKLRLDAPYRADCFYGLSKVWGEALGQMYWTKHGIETVALRIGTFMNLPPRNTRELSSWLGAEDLAQLVRKSVEATGIGFAPVWGISANTRAWYDMDEPNAIGYQPVQDAEAWAGEIAAQPATAPDPVAERYQGGRFVTQSWTSVEQRPGQAGR